MEDALLTIMGSVIREYAKGKLELSFYAYLYLIFDWAMARERKGMNEIETQFALGLEKKDFLASAQYTPQGSNRRLDFAVVGKAIECLKDTSLMANHKFQEEFKLGIEIDGREYHTGLDNEEKDFCRDLELTELGWKIIHFTGKDVYHDLEKCLDFVEKVYKERSKSFWEGLKNHEKEAKISTRKELLEKRRAEVDGEEKQLVERELNIMAVKDLIDEVLRRLGNENLDEGELSKEKENFKYLTGQLKELESYDKKGIII